MKPDPNAMLDLVNRFRESADHYENEIIGMMELVERYEKMVADYRVAADEMEDAMREVEKARNPLRVVEPISDIKTSLRMWNGKQWVDENFNPDQPVDISAMKAERKVPRYFDEAGEWITKGEDKYLADEGL